MSGLVAANTYIAMPKDPGDQDRILQIWLQVGRPLTSSLTCQSGVLLAVRARARTASWVHDHIQGCLCHVIEQSRSCSLLCFGYSLSTKLLVSKTLVFIRCVVVISVCLSLSSADRRGYPRTRPPVVKAGANNLFRSHRLIGVCWLAGVCVGGGGPAAAQGGARQQRKQGSRSAAGKGAHVVL